jgi:hypothetical protein
MELQFHPDPERLVHLVGFIIRKFVTMHGHMIVKNIIRILSIFEVFKIQNNELCVFNHCKTLFIIPKMLYFILYNTSYNLVKS